jgi:hypothetical protein
LEVPAELDRIVDNNKLETLLMDYLRSRDGEALVLGIRAVASAAQ